MQARYLAGPLWDNTAHHFGRNPAPRHLTLNLIPKVKSEVKGQGRVSCPWRLGIF